jgi:hypothetical protein
MSQCLRLCDFFRISVKQYKLYNKLNSEIVIKESKEIMLD